MIKYEKRAREAKNVEFNRSGMSDVRPGMGGQTSPSPISQSFPEIKYKSKPYETH